MSGEPLYEQTSLSRVLGTMFIVSAIRPLRAFPMMVLHQMSMKSAVTFISCCVTEVSVAVETKKKYGDVGVVGCSLKQFVGG